MKTTSLIRVAAIGACCLSPALWASGGGSSYELTRSAVTGGGPTVGKGGGFELTGAVEPNDTPASGGDGYNLTGGFTIPVVPTDCDEDGYVSWVDYAALDACFTGPDGLLPPGCDCYDVNRDLRVDMMDFAEAQVFFTGP